MALAVAGPGKPVSITGPGQRPGMGMQGMARTRHRNGRRRIKGIAARPPASSPSPAAMLICIGTPLNGDTLTTTRTTISGITDTAHRRLVRRE